MYAVHQVRESGFSVVALEAAPSVGGVWYHNGYPGARVDVDSVEYCYFFSQELYSEWRWSERYAPQGELLAYLEFVADRFDLKRSIEFGARVTSATWDSDQSRYEVTTEDGRRFAASYLLMAVGNLSAPKPPDLPDLEAFRGQVYQTSSWPVGGQVDLTGKRVALFGTGSSGVQAVPAIAEVADQLYVFQRTPNFSVPAVNGPADVETWRSHAVDVGRVKRELQQTRLGRHVPTGTRSARDYSESERRELMERTWSAGGHAFGAMFPDQTTDPEVNSWVADFVRDKIRATVSDAVVAELLCPDDHPIGARRLCLDTGYYETFNRPNVSLVDVRTEPLTRFVPEGIQTEGGVYHVDAVVLALGFRAFGGALYDAGLVGVGGVSLAQWWESGPKTFLGIMSSPFPNLFVVAGAGSPSVLSNMTASIEQHVDWIVTCLTRMREQGMRVVSPREDAEERWVKEVDEAASALLRKDVTNYMVHVNADGSKHFMPYAGGFGRYVSICQDEADAGYPSLVLNS